MTFYVTQWCERPFRTCSTSNSPCGCTSAPSPLLTTLISLYLEPVASPRAHSCVYASPTADFHPAYSDLSFPRFPQSASCLFSFSWSWFGCAARLHSLASQGTALVSSSWASFPAPLPVTRHSSTLFADSFRFTNWIAFSRANFSWVFVPSSAHISKHSWRLHRASIGWCGGDLLIQRDLFQWARCETSRGGRFTGLSKGLCIYRKLPGPTSCCALGSVCAALSLLSQGCHLSNSRLK